MNDDAISKEDLNALFINERKFRILVESSPMAIYMSSGPEQKAEYINPKFTEMFGYDIEDVPQMSEWCLRVYPDPVQRALMIGEWQKRIVIPIQNEGSIEPMVCHITCKDGSEKVVEWGFVSVQGKNIAFGEDITFKKKAEIELRNHKINLERQVMERTAELRIAYDRMKVFDDALHFSSSAVAICELDGSIDFINPSFVKMWGYDDDGSLIGRNLTEFMRSLDSISSPIQKVLDEGIFSGEMIATRSNGIVFFVDVLMNVVLNEKMEPMCIVSSMMDITEKKRFISDQIKAKNRYLTLFEKSPDGVAIYDPISLLPVEFNFRSHDQLGYSQAEFIGKPLDKLVACECSLDFKDKVRLAMDEGEITTEVVFLTEGKEPRNMLVTIQPLVLEAQNLVLILSRDITEIKKVELDLLRKTDLLQRSNDDLEQFAYVASHDLQEPLRMVSSFMQLLDERYSQELDDDAKDFIKYAVDGAKRMHNIINDLLDYSRVNSQGKDFEIVNMNSVLDQVLLNLNMTLKGCEGQVTIGELPSVFADEAQMVNLVQNLVGNAIKYRKPGTRPEIVVGSSALPGEIVFSISDNGIGIDPKYHERIFKIFQRLHARGEYDGSGIGLAIADRIVKRHGGRIWVESALGKGSKFFFSIPHETRC